jgi:hypothetical protein
MKERTRLLNHVPRFSVHKKRRGKERSKRKRREILGKNTSINSKGRE